MLSVMYWLEPWIELNNPLFRLGSIKNHLQYEFKALLDSKKCTVTLLTSQQIAMELSLRFNLENVKIYKIEQKELKKNFNNYHDASLAWFNQEYTDEHVKTMSKVIKKTLGNYIPDVIIVYESSAPFFKKIFPKTLILNNMLGIFSREPFPEMSILEPVGIYKNSFINTRLSSKLSKFNLDKDEKKALSEVQEKYKQVILEQTPFDYQIRNGFSKVILLPLQVSKYFAYSANLPSKLNIENQYDLMISILNSLPSNIGIIVTEHGAENNVITTSNYSSLKEQYPNLIIIQDIKQLKWGSQYLLPYVDAVISVSSSVALQAFFWNKTVISYGDCFKMISDNNGKVDIDSLLISLSKHKDSISTREKILFFTSTII